MHLTQDVKQFNCESRLTVNDKEATMVTIKTSADIPVAPNNLHKMVVKSGLKNQMVAELKGVQPGTLSRHKSGDIAISLSDAEDYAKILNVKQWKYFLPTRPSRFWQWQIAGKMTPQNIATITNVL